jgi:hypothetical protein
MSFIKELNYRVNAHASRTRQFINNMNLIQNSTNIDR